MFAVGGLGGHLLPTAPTAASISPVPSRGRLTTTANSPSPGAFQSTHGFQMCSGTPTLEHVPLFLRSEATMDGSKLIYATFVGGTSGSAVVGMSVDKDGNVLLAAELTQATTP